LSARGTRLSVGSFLTADERAALALALRDALASRAAALVARP